MRLYVNGTYRAGWRVPSLQRSRYVRVQNYVLPGALSTGNYKVELFADATNTVRESIESDNQYTSASRSKTG